MDADFIHHAAREVPKAMPGLGVVMISGLLSLPWQALGYMLGVILIVVQLAYTIWKWRRESRVKAGGA